MYCACNSLERARLLFDRFIPMFDQIAYSVLMKAYLSSNQPFEVLLLFDRFQPRSVKLDCIFYNNILHACRRLGLPRQAEQIHREIQSSITRHDLSLQINLIEMHANCSQLSEATRLFHLLKLTDSSSFGHLLYGYAIHGRGQQALTLYNTMKNKITCNAQVYRTLLYACACTGGLVKEARHLYKQMPDKFRTPNMMAIMVRRRLFDVIDRLTSYLIRSQYWLVLHTSMKQNP
jgi:hypothetical protein